MVEHTDDTPELIRKIAENKDYLLFCAVIVKSGLDSRFAALQKTIISESRRLGLSHEHVQKKLMPVALSLGIYVDHAELSQADYYRVLGVPPLAAPDDIKKAYRSKARLFHPDSEAGSNDRFIRIHNAYTVLANEDLRRQYDMSREQAKGWTWREGHGSQSPPDHLRGTGRRFGLMMAAVIALLIGTALTVDLIDREFSLEGGIDGETVKKNRMESQFVTIPAKSTQMTIAENDGMILPENAGGGRYKTEPEADVFSRGKMEAPAAENMIRSSTNPQILMQRPAAVVAAKNRDLSRDAAQKKEVPIPAAAEQRENNGESEFELSGADSNPEQAKTEITDIPDLIRQFLTSYCCTYENKNLEKFMGFFTDTALENGKTVKSLLPRYRENFAVLDSIAYRIEAADYIVDLERQRILVNGNFRLDWTRKGEKQLHQHSGRIRMELLHEKDYLFKVDRLFYEFKN